MIYFSHIIEVKQFHINATYIMCPTNAPSSSLMDSTLSPKMKTMEGEGVGGCSLACNTSRVEGRAKAPRWD